MSRPFGAQNVQTPFSPLWGERMKLCPEESRRGEGGKSEYAFVPLTLTLSPKGERGHFFRFYQ
jgi:hypothetical protein